MNDNETAYYWDEEKDFYFYLDENNNKIYVTWDEKENGFFAVEFNDEDDVNTFNKTDSDIYLENYLSNSVIDSEKLDSNATLSKRVSFPEIQSVNNDYNLPNNIYKLNGSQDGKTHRSSNRHLSFSNCGGLSGCVKVANEERKQRQSLIMYSDEEIRLENEREKLRKKLAEEGLGRKESSISRTSDNISNTTSLNDFDNNSMTNSLNNESQSNSASDFIERKGRRRSTVRFGTKQFEDPSILLNIETMLNKTIKQ